MLKMESPFTSTNKQQQEQQQQEGNMPGEPKIHDTAVVCRGADIQGDVTIGPGTTVHPTAKIIAEVNEAGQRQCVCVYVCVFLFISSPPPCKTDSVSLSLFCDREATQLSLGQTTWLRSRLSSRMSWLFAWACAWTCALSAM